MHGGRHHASALTESSTRTSSCPSGSGRELSRSQASASAQSKSHHYLYRMHSTEGSTDAITTYRPDNAPLSLIPLFGIHNVSDMLHVVDENISQLRKHSFLLPRTPSQKITPTYRCTSEFASNSKRAERNAIDSSADAYTDPQESCSSQSLAKSLSSVREVQRGREEAASLIAPSLTIIGTLRTTQFESLAAAQFMYGDATESLRWAPYYPQTTALRVSICPSKKRVRAACSFCRLRKLRCDAEKPCSQCKKRDLTCVYLPEATQQIRTDFQCQVFQERWLPLDFVMHRQTDGDT